MRPRAVRAGFGIGLVTLDSSNLLADVTGVERDDAELGAVYYIIAQKPTPVAGH